MRSDRSARGWAFGFAQDYFGWDSHQASQVTGKDGWRHMLALWEQHGEAIYAMPEYVLRQEWFHGLGPTISRAYPSFFDALSPSARLLDFGCGTAEVTRRPWTDAGREAILMDVESPNLAYVRAKYPQQNVTVRTVREGLPARYDALVCLDVLEHIPSPMAVLREVWERLRPGGYALLWFDGSFPAGGHLQASIDELPAYDAWLTTETHILHQGWVDWVQKPRRWWQVLA